MTATLWVLLLFGGMLAVDLALAPAGQQVSRGQAREGAGGDHPEAGGLSGALVRLARAVVGPSGEEVKEEVAEGQAKASGKEAATTPLQIRVLGPDGPQPAMGATVFLDEKPLGVTDAQGLVTVPFVLDGERHDAWAEKGEHKAEAFFLSERNLPPGILTLVLRGTGTLRGLVLDTRGKPVKGAEITVRPAAADPQQSDAKGAFDLGALPEGGYSIAARGESSKGTIWANVVAAGTQEVVITLRPALRVSGVVVDDLGAPLPGVEIRSWGNVRRDRQGPVETDAAGRFSFLVTDLRDVQITVKHEGRSGEYRGPPREGLHIVARRAGRITVIARRPSGEPVTRALFSLRGLDPETGKERFAKAALTDVPGHFLADMLSAGLWEISVVGEPPPLASVELAAGEAREVEVELAAETGRIRGRVVDARSGEGIVGAVVKVAPRPWMFRVPDAEPSLRSTRSGADGAFSFDAVDDKSRALRAEADGYLPAQAQAQVATAGETPRETKLALEPARRVRGIVVDEKRLPLMEFFLDGKHIEASDGVFDEPLAQAARTLRVGGFGRTERALELPPGPGDVDLGEVMLDDARPVRVRVLQPDGAPAVGAVVFAQALRGRWSTGSAGTDREGRVLMVMPPGAYRFQASHPGFGQSASVEQDNATSGGEEILLRLEAAAWVVGDAGGPGYVITAINANRSTLSGRDGRYRIGPLAREEVFLLRTARDPTRGRPPTRSPRISVRPGEETRYDFEASDTGSVRIECAPELSGYVLLQNTDTASPFSIGQGVGRGGVPCPALLGGVPPGAYDLSFRPYDRSGRQAFVRQSLTVDAGRATEVHLGGG